MDETATNASAAKQLGKAVRSNLIAAAATGIAGGVVAALVAAWALVETVPGRVGLVPSGAVAAFDLKEGCPSGWISYDQGAGRFVIGAASKIDLEKMPSRFAKDARGDAIAERPFGEPSGEQSHLLTEPEMPKHHHESTAHNDGAGFGGVDIGGGQERYRTEDAGGNQPHNNMPPYIALWLCKKT